MTDGKSGMIDLLRAPEGLGSADIPALANRRQLAALHCAGDESDTIRSRLKFIFCFA